MYIHIQIANIVLLNNFKSRYKCRILSNFLEHFREFDFLKFIKKNLKLQQILQKKNRVKIPTSHTNKQEYL